jgi:hypothetical protein
MGLFAFEPDPDASLLERLFARAALVPMGTDAAPLPDEDASRAFTRGAVQMAPGGGSAALFGYRPRYDTPASLLPSGFDKGPSLFDQVATASQDGSWGQPAMTLFGALPDAGYAAAAAGGAARALNAPLEMPAITRLSESRPTDFRYSPRTGGIDWGNISPDIARETGGAVEALPLRVHQGEPRRPDGTGGFGFAKVAEREDWARKLGFADNDAYIDHVARNFNTILQQPGQGSIALMVRPGQGAAPDKAISNFMAVRLSRDPFGGDFYRMSTILPGADERYLKSAGKSIIWERK